MDRRGQLYRILDHELRIQSGSSFDEWCVDRGLDPSETVRALMSDTHPEILRELADAIGLNSASLASIAA